MRNLLLNGTNTPPRGCHDITCNLRISIIDTLKQHLGLSKSGHGYLCFQIELEFSVLSFVEGGKLENQDRNPIIRETWQSLFPCDLESENQSRDVRGERKQGRPHCTRASVILLHHPWFLEWHVINPHMNTELTNNRCWYLLIDICRKGLVIK